MNNLQLLILLILFICKQENRVDINFNVRDEKNRIVQGANIRISPCNCTEAINRKTSCNGSVLVKGIFKNTYKVTISKEGFKEKKFLINACKDINCNIHLCHYNKNRLYGYITDMDNNVIDRAIVVIYRVLENKLYFPIRFTYTDFTGEYNFFDIPKGTYIVKSIK